MLSLDVVSQFLDYFQILVFFSLKLGYLILEELNLREKFQLIRLFGLELILEFLHLD